MNKHTGVKAVAYAFQTVGLLVFLYSILLVITTESIFFMLYGIIGFILWYAMGGVLLVLVDIAKSVRASAVVAIEQEERRRTIKPSSNGKSVGLQRIDTKKRREA